MRVLDDSSSFFGDGPQCWPPGFRFHPTDEELVLYYLKRKICRRRLKLDIVGETDVYKWEPEELPGISKLRTGDRLWFFFSPRDRKYPNGARSNRATRHGYWKATGKDRNVTCNSRTVGVKKTLVFYKGRAPSGVRTDWVMHEYTLDEEELKRCSSVQDYFALYKVFKKSGPGPKNGEQYGAPFREEDWADDENTIVNDHVDQENSAKEVIEAASVDNTTTNCQLQSPFNDLQEFINRIEDHPVQDEPVNVGPPAVDYCYTLQGVVGGEETQSALVDQSLIEGNFHDRSMVLNPSNNGASFDLTHSADSQMQLYETSDVTSAPNILRQESNESGVNFLEDYIEMDDLVGPQPTFENFENPVENLFENQQFENFDGLSELDLFHDAAMFLQDMGPPMNMGPVSHSIQDLGPLNMGPVSHPIQDMNPINMGPVSHPIQDMNPINMGQVHQLNFDSIGNEMVNQFYFQLQQHTNDETQINSLLWTPAESNRGTFPPPSSGVVYDAISASQPSDVNQNENQNQNLQEADGSDTWLSSLFWNVVESIPTTPASASESSALVNKALERISSFGRIGSGVRISAGDSNVNAGNPTAAPKKSSNSWYNRLFFIFSLLVVVCAFLWMLRGTSVEVLGRFIS